MPLSRLLVSQCSLSGHTTKQLPQVFFLHRGPPVEVGGSASASLLACCEVLSEPLWLPALGRQWAVLSVPLVMSRWYAGAAPNWSPRLGHGAPIAHRERAAAPECRVNVLHSCDHSGIAATTDSHECRAPWLEGVGGGWPPEVILKCDHFSFVHARIRRFLLESSSSRLVAWISSELGISFGTFRMLTREKN